MKKILSIVLSILIMVSAGQASTVTGVISAPSSTGQLKNATVTFTLSQSGIVPGSFVLTTSPIVCGTDEAGNIVGLVEPVVAPAASINLGSGSLPAASYFIRLTYWNASGETQPGPETSFTLVSPGTLTILAPALQPSSASGYKVYISTATGTETLQSTVTGWGSYSNSTSLISGAALPGSNTSLCDVRFNDSIIPTDTIYAVSVTSQSGATIPGFSQPWYLSGSSINVTNNYPLATNRTARFPYPIVANPSSNATQSINSPLTLNGYAMTAGATILPNNAAPPATAVGKTIMYTDNTGVAKVCQNGSACTNLIGGTNGWTINGTDIRESTVTNSVLVGTATSDLTPQSGGGGTGVLVAKPFLYTISAATNARVGSLGLLTGSATMTIASGVSGTQTTGWPLTFRVCPAAGDCSALGTTEAGRVEPGGRWVLGLGASTSSDFVGGGFISEGLIAEVNSAANAQAITMAALGGAGGVGKIESTYTGGGSYKPLAFYTNGAEAGRFTVTNKNLVVGASTDTDTTQVILGQRDQNTSTYLQAKNNTTDTAALAAFRATANGGGDVTFGVTSGAYTPATGIGAGVGFIHSAATNGMTIETDSGSLTMTIAGATKATLAGTGLTLSIPLKQTSGGTGQSSAITANQIVYSDGTAYNGAANLTWDNANSLFETIGGVLAKSATRANPAAGTWLQMFMDSSGPLGNIIAYDYTGAVYKNLKISGLTDVLNANGTDVITVSSGKVNIRLASVSAYANNAAAIAGGLAQGDIYRTNGDPDALAIVH